MRAAKELDPAVTAGECQRQQHGLQHQHDGTRAAARAREAHIEDVISGYNRSFRRELHTGRAERVAAELRAADCGGST